MPRTAVKQVSLWDKVHDKLSAGLMPPPGIPGPSKDEVAAVTGWIEHLPGRAAARLVSAENTPGRVTARRLNRAEYNNTIRDLLGVNVRPADEFPVDDAGYGFDNIGDVLTLSPLLMEKYMAAARTVSKVAVYGETLPAQPSLLAVLMPKKGPDDPLPPSGGTILPYSIRGAMYGSFVFPVDAEYEIRVRVINHRDPGGRVDYDSPLDVFLSQLRAASGLPGVQEGAQPVAPGRGGRGATGSSGGRGRVSRGPATPADTKLAEEKSRTAFAGLKMILTLDGKPILEDLIEGDTNYKYDRGAVAARVPVKAGAHYLRASFPELADLDDPRRNINGDGRRRDYIEFAEIAGPYNPSHEPPASYKQIFICSEHTAQCATKILRNLTERAYRRPVKPEEITRLASLVTLAQKQGDTFQEGIRLALQTILMSPDFLFRTESDPPLRSGSPAPAHRISDYELASRLSYFLWSSMPDEELFRLAREQKLHESAVLEAQVRRMLADSKSASLVDNFAGQWLGIRTLDRKPPDPGRFATADDELLDYMHRETNMFVAAMFREDRNILDFIDAPFTYLNGPLARHYGIPGVTGEEFRRVDLKGTERSGLLTQGAILIASSYPTRTSVVTRGKWVLENFLGTPPPPPPPNVPALTETDLGTAASLREKMEQHRANPTCAVCHKQMDPIGFGLENYDASGAWRTLDGKFPINASGTLPDGKSFNGAAGLKAILRSQSDLFTRNLTTKMMTYAVGRGMERFDEPAINGIVQDLSTHDYKFSRMVMDIVNSKPFLMRSADTDALKGKL